MASSPSQQRPNTGRAASAYTFTVVLDPTTHSSSFSSSSGSRSSAAPAFPPTSVAAIATSAVLLLLATSEGAEASVTFDNCTQHFVRGVPPTQLPPDTVSVALCKGGAFGLSYDKPLLNPQYSAYSVTPQQIKDVDPTRVSGFRQDTDLRDLKIPQANASSAVYSTIYNRGHIAPSRMLGYSYWSKFQTYYYSNVAPQWWQFNQQTWETGEDALFNTIGGRFVAGNPNGINDVPFYLVTGVEYRDRDAGVVRNSSVGMPDYFYTAVCNPATRQSMAFIGMNEGKGGDGNFLLSLVPHRTRD